MGVEADGATVTHCVTLRGGTIMKHTFAVLGAVSGLDAVDVDRRRRTGRCHHARRRGPADRRPGQHRPLLRQFLSARRRHHQRQGRHQGRRQDLQAGAEALRQPVRSQPGGAPVHAAPHLRQGELPARAVCQQLRARHQLGRREVSGAHGRGRRRLRPDLLARLQIRLRHPAAGRRLLLEHHRDARQARSQADDRRAGRGR